MNHFGAIARRLLCLTLAFLLACGASPLEALATTGEGGAQTTAGEQPPASSQIPSDPQPGDPAVCPHHTEHTAECGYIAARDEVPCDRDCADTDGDGVTDHAEDCADTPAVEGSPCAYVCRICPVQERIDALPEADGITADNAEEVKAQLSAIEEALAALTEDERSQADTVRYTEAADALAALEQENEPEETQTEETQPEETEPVELTVEGETAGYVPDADALPNNDELFAGYAWRTLYGESSIATLGNYGEDALTGTNLELHNALKAEIQKVAANGGSTVFTVTLTTPITWESTATTNDELGTEADIAFQEAVDHNKVIDCLLADCPYEMYWFDKDTTSGVGYSSSASNGVGSISEIQFTFYVAEDYRDSGNTTVSVEKATLAANAAVTARQVVADNADKSDYEKLLAYKIYICNAVSYNDSAANPDNNTPYGDPWQLIYVFDGKEDTNVVCEGYAKAFQYLCDLGGLTCYTVTGNMSGEGVVGAGEHMWNIVTLDGANYLVDVTNSDEKTVGASGGLFLAGTSGSVDAGYTFTIGSQTITFTYDNKTRSLYSDSILTLAETDYTEPAPEPDYVAEVTIGGTTTQYTDIQAAFTAANAVAADNPATVTLLDDATVADGENINVTGNVTLEGGKYTISGTYKSEYAFSGLILVSPSGNLTVQSGTIRNEVSGSNQDEQSICIFVNNGALTVNNGNIMALRKDVSAITYGICITGGSLEISGGTISAEDFALDNSTSAYGVRIELGNVSISGGHMEGKYSGIYVTGGNVKLSGGTFDGQHNAINGSTIGQLLADGYVYYEGEKAEGTPAYGVKMTARELPAGTFTVGKCVNHDWSDGDHVCTYCNTQAVASVEADGTTGYYGTIEDAWAAAKGSTATITLLADVTVSTALTVDEGDDITLTSDTAYSISGNIPYDSPTSIPAIIHVTGGVLTFQSGTINSTNAQGEGIRITSGTLNMKGGTISAGGEGILVAGSGAEVNIESGNISGESRGLSVSAAGKVTLSGGTFSSPSPGTAVFCYTGKSVGSILAENYAYKQDGSWVSDTSVATLKGTITVAEAPIQSVSISADADTAITYGDTAPTLTATADLAEGVSEDAVTYQWYQDGEKIVNATERTYTPGSLNAGDYIYTCKATADGHSLTSKAVTITVQPANISSAVVTLSGTEFYYIGGTEIAVQSVVLNGNELTVLTDYTYSGHTGTDAGTYTVTVEGKGNYTGTATAKWEIYQKELTVTNWTIEKAYDGTADITLDAADAVLYGVCGQDDVKLDVSGVTAQFADAAVGENKSITYTGSFALTGSAAKNYTLKYQPILTGTITKAEAPTVPEQRREHLRDESVTGTIDLGKLLPADKGETTYTVTGGEGVATGSVNGDTLTYTTVENTAAVSGDLIVTAVMQNYEDVTITVNIGLADPLTVSGQPDSVTYGDAPFTLTASGGLGDNPVTWESSNENIAKVDENGEVTITGAGTVTITATKKDGANQGDATAEVSFTVGKRELVVAVDDQTKTYGEADPELTYKAEGLLSGDTLTLTRIQGEDAGNYAIAGYVITARDGREVTGSYQATVTQGKLTIEKRDIADAKVVLGDALVANGRRQTQTLAGVTVENSKGEVLDVTYSVTGNTGAQPGAYTMTLTGTGNFTGSLLQTFAIAPSAANAGKTDGDGNVILGDGTITVETRQVSGPVVTRNTGKAAILELLVNSGDLTAQELARVAEGEDIDVILETADATASITGQSKARMQKLASGYTIGQYLHIQLYKQLDGERTRILATSGKVSLSVTVPQSLLNTDKAVTRTFYIVSSHDGGAEFLPATYSAEDNTLTFETDDFADFAIVYKDAKKPSGNPDAPNNTATGAIPRTGDHSGITLWLPMLALSAAGILAFGGYALRRKRRR